MADVVFLTGVVDVLDYAGRLLRKKYREGGRVAVYGPPPLLQRLDQALWVAEQLDFTPHVWLRQGAALPPAATVARTPLWLLSRPVAGLDCESGVNLGLDEPELAAAHARLAEVIGVGEQEVAAGRERWRRYKAEGHALRSHAQS